MRNSPEPTVAPPNRLPRALTLSPEQFESILRTAASQDKVRDAILNSHDDSRWWPLFVTDWRLRMLIAGLSARISYRSVPTYQQVVRELHSLGYDAVAKLTDEGFHAIIARLGLPTARLRVWRSLRDFISWTERNEVDLSRFSNRELIDLMQEKVSGASYKLAQCCVLYARGYHCGVIPVDSGMKDLLAPCLGFPAPRGAFAHETLRREFEELVAQVDCRRIALELGYGELALPDDRPLTWWAHIVLISYKRFFCNQQKPSECALRQAFPASRQQLITMGTRCDKSNSRVGGVGLVLIEGANGTGKTTVADLLHRCGYDVEHFGYAADRTGADIVTLYRDLLHSTVDRRLVLDRSFISEEAYGRALRGGSRLSSDQYRELLALASERNAVVIYLSAPEPVLQKRAADESRRSSHHVTTADQTRAICREFASALEVSETVLPVFRADSAVSSAERVVEDLVGSPTFQAIVSRGNERVRSTAVGLERG